MTVINLIDKSKLHALECRCNNLKDMAEHVMSFLTVTTLQHLPAFANDLFTNSFRDHLGKMHYRLVLDECRQIPHIFRTHSNKKKAGNGDGDGDGAEFCPGQGWSVEVEPVANERGVRSVSRL